MAAERGYIGLWREGKLKKRGEELWQVLEQCRLCPRECGARRLQGEEGECEAGRDVEVASYHAHFGEEKPLVGTGGSGTIFFHHCSLRCVFCINWDISQGENGSRRSVEDLARMMLALQAVGCHNINLVTPTQYSPHIVLALDRAAGGGLRIPLVYNTSGWERLEILRILDGIVDIYLADFKYARPEASARYSPGVETYPEVTKRALCEMDRQVGVAHPGPHGLMERGLMIRLLMMPNDVSGTREAVHWIARNLPRDTYVNLMSQYAPTFKAFQYPELSRRITREEFGDAVRWAREEGLTNLDVQA